MTLPNVSSTVKFKLEVDLFPKTKHPLLNGDEFCFLN